MVVCSGQGVSHPHRIGRSARGAVEKKHGMAPGFDTSYSAGCSLNSPWACDSIEAGETWANFAKE